MTQQVRLPLAEIEERVCKIAASQVCLPRNEVSPSSRLIEDLSCDSVEFVELMMSLEDEFSVSLPDPSQDSLFKSLFTRQPVRLSDLAEAIYIYQGTGAPERGRWFGRRIFPTPDPSSVPFTQLSGVWNGNSKSAPLLEPLSDTWFRRRTDGMRCVLLPAAEVEIGSPLTDAPSDERPLHTAELDEFFIDAEPVSTTAYCRFLNSIDADRQDLAEWFLAAPRDHRGPHLPIELFEGKWRPREGLETCPMMLVSWFGANAYSLWVNGCDWRDNGEDAPFLPTEAQWEYAARGASSQTYPWGNDNDSDAPLPMTYSQHQPGAAYQVETMPLSPVNKRLGMSPFGLHHMAGNIWQWCRDWYDPDFYSRPEAAGRNPINRRNTGIRSERGGSWVGPAELCRSSYRRGRPPYARGRCLGFRCITAATAR